MRDYFLVNEKFIYINHASTGIIPEPAVKKMEKVIKDFARFGDPGVEYIEGILNEGREIIASLLKTAPENIAFTMNTSEGMLIALLNIPLKKGDNVLVMEESFPASKYISEYNIPGIKVRYIKFSGEYPVAVVKKGINSKTRAVIVDQVQYFTGERLYLKELSEFLKDRDIFLIVDGIQALGSIDVDVNSEGIDVFACGGAKWLNAPQGTGFLYVSPEIFERMKKVHTGWLGAPWEGFHDFNIQPEPFEDARRFETGTRNIIGISGLTESIKILLEYGPENIEARIHKLNNILLNRFKDKNYEIITPEERMAGIITVRMKDNSTESIFRRLRENNIIVSLRNNAIRLSPHFYNTENEIEEVLELV